MPTKNVWMIHKTISNGAKHFETDMIFFTWNIQYWYSSTFFYFDSLKLLLFYFFKTFECIFLSFIFIKDLVWEPHNVHSLIKMISVITCWYYEMIDRITKGLHIKQINYLFGDQSKRLISL